MLLAPRTAERGSGSADDRDALANEKRTRLANLDVSAAIRVKMPVWVVPGHADGTATVHVRLRPRARRQRSPMETGKGVHHIRVLRSAEWWCRCAGCRDAHRLNIRSPVCRSTRRSTRNSSTSATSFAPPASPSTPQPELRGRRTRRAWEKGAGHEGAEDSLYPPYEYKEYAWAMSIDTSVCTGLQRLRDRLPVGEQHCDRRQGRSRARARDALAAHRPLLQGNPTTPRSIHQPVPCMQCENAPCEPVCPVGATSHSVDGLNDMTYNRCVGTRYCSNNCPYKVRRFNFFQYSDYDTPALQAACAIPTSRSARAASWRSARTACSASSPRRSRPRRESRRVRDGEIVTACQQACPTDAIVFGDLNDRNSHVSQLKSGADELRAARSSSIPAPAPRTWRRSETRTRRSRDEAEVRRGRRQK